MSKSFNVLSVVALGVLSNSPPATAAALPDGLATKSVFERVASFPVFLNTDIDLETVAEIVAVGESGRTLVYTDSETEQLGFVDITHPRQPKPAGVVRLPGEPTSVAVAGRYALVAVNTSPSFIAPSGDLVVVDMHSQSIVDTFPLGGQPDAISVSPDKRYAAIAIENERDEDLGDGTPPQAPSGFLVVVRLQGAPANWTMKKVDLDGVADRFPNDAEPEYVDINDHNIAVVTLQENNHIVLVDLRTAKVIKDFSAGEVSLDRIDTLENDLIELNSSLRRIPREPDGVVWLTNYRFATADEGDLDGGSRGFTIYGKSGRVKFSSGSTNDHMAARLGHYPEHRSENKGNEPENVEFGRYGDKKYLFVGSERSSVIFVYRLIRNNRDLVPRLVQVLPAGVGPEGLLAIPQRDLFVAASEVDDRGDKIRSVLNIYKRVNRRQPSYPTVVSANRPGGSGTSIPWGALSGLASDPERSHLVHAVHDSFYRQSRIFRVDVRRKPAVIKNETVLKDPKGRLRAVAAALVNDDGTVNLDLEGIATRKGGGFWLVSEGAGTVGDPDRPFESLNLLLAVDRRGRIERVITLPDSVNARQVRFGFEGVAAVKEKGREIIYVAFQREWSDDPEGLVRIGRYDGTSGDWTFYYYPLAKAPLGWVGLSEITPLGNGEFAVIERDNQAGPDASIKRIYRFSVAGLKPLPDPAAGQVPGFPVVKKRRVRDLMPDLRAPGGLVLEKIEGLTVLKNGTALVVNDNDGVDDSSGETQLIRIKRLFR